MKIKILLVDNAGLFRAGVAALIKERHGDIEVLGCSDNGFTAVEMARQLQPDVMLMGTLIPGLSGIEATRQIKREQADIQILALSSHSEREYVLEMLRAGASGYILKECLFDELEVGIRVVASGQSYLSPQIASIVLASITNDHVDDISIDSTSLSLTQRDRQVLQLLVHAKSAKQIASQLKLSVKTVEADRRQIMEKLEVHNLVDLTKYAIRKGITVA